MLRLKDGETLRAVGASYGISFERVRQIARAAGVRSARWIDKVNFSHRTDVDAILGWLDRGMPHAHIAEAVGCLPQTVAILARRYRGYKPARDDRAWTAKETAFLTKRYKTKGWSAADIADHLGRTRDEVIGKANRLGLCRPPPKPQKTIHGRIRLALANNPTLPTSKLARLARCTPKRAGIGRWQVTNAEHRRNQARQRHAERAAA